MQLYCGEWSTTVRLIISVPWSVREKEEKEKGRIQGCVDFPYSLYRDWQASTALTVQVCANDLTRVELALCE